MKAEIKKAKLATSEKEKQGADLVVNTAVKAGPDIYPICP